jgi:hypothetical protein
LAGGRRPTADCVACVRWASGDVVVGR